MTDTTQLGKIIAFLYKTDMVKNLKKLDGTDLFGGTEFLTLAIAELETTYNWDVDLAVEAYTGVFELYRIKVIPREFDEADFIEMVKVNTDSNEERSIEEYAQVFGFEVTPELKAKFEDKPQEENSFTEPAI